MDASSFMTQWQGHWAEFVGSGWMPAVSTLVVLLVLALLWSSLRRAPATPDYSDYKPDGDQFAYTPPINDEQIALLHYLQRAFPDGAVLFRPRLARFLAVRKSRQKRAAMQRLADAQVDFLICTEEGRPLFAFEVDAFKHHDDPEAARNASEKNQMLKTAGIRLIRLKGSHAHWPPPEVLRLRLMTSRRPPTPEAVPSGFAPSEFSPSRFGQSDFPHSRQPPASDVMGLSGLMAMEAGAGANPWKEVRKRS